MGLFTFIPFCQKVFLVMNIFRQKLEARAVGGTAPLIVQWNLSIMVTLGPPKSGCYKEVACLYRSICTQNPILGPAHVAVIE